MADIRTTTTPDTETAPGAPSAPSHVAIRRDEENKERVCKQCGEAIVVEEKA